jgi:Flp pilus assembly protein TadD
LSAVYWEGNKFDKALAVLTKLMTLEPDNPQSYIMASKIYGSMGDKAMAKKYYDKVTALFPNIEEMLNGRAGALCREGEKLMAEGRNAEAERKFKEALMMKPDSVPALIDMGSVAAGKGDLAGAAGYFGKAIALDPLNPQAHYNLSMAYELMGRQVEAATELKKYKELDASARQSNR